MCFSLFFHSSYHNMEEEKTKNSYSLPSETSRVTLNSSKSVSYGSNGRDNPTCDMTSETFPRMHNYTDIALMKRPSLGELHGDYITEKVKKWSKFGAYLSSRRSFSFNPLRSIEKYLLGNNWEAQRHNQPNDFCFLLENSLFCRLF